MPSLSNNIPILNAEQIRLWDAYTIENEPIASIDLMERASIKCSNYLIDNYPEATHFVVICGTGNNGGDGLAIARLLLQQQKNISVVICGNTSNGSNDFLINLNRLQNLNVITLSYSNGIIKDIVTEHAIIVDALFGTGVNRPANEDFKFCIDEINQCSNTIVSIDVPSGLYIDKPNLISDSIVKAHKTLTFQCPKLSFLFPDNANFVGDFELLNIGLLIGYINKIQPKYWLLTESYIRSKIHKRNTFDHKGKNGRALLIAGSYSKYGAAILASRAALHSGLGLLTVHIPKSGLETLHTACPEAMLSVDNQDDFSSQLPDVSNFDAVGVGPAIGINDLTKELILNVFQCNKPMVVDADAITLFAFDLSLKSQLPKQIILTPHVKEFERIVGKCQNAFERHIKQVEFSKRQEVYIILKGAYSCLTCPDGTVYFNSTGNPGMAKGGSGDALTGIVTALLAQGYSVKDSAILGMYIHGYAGDLAALDKGEISMLPSDLIEQLSNAFKHLTK